ncbi:MAG: Glu/Leu/Phe/Val dehydrogenase [Bdellovibrionales bacterium]|nr:Glu/Leu/Phe/Val dehydrogenase [Bdellovibrionales bacterium]
MSLSVRDFEQVTFCNDEKTGLQAIIAVHSTALGPAVGGCRMWDYASSEEALTDALRLSKGMTYKASISGLNWGGGKSVIVGPASKKTPELLAKFGEFVNRLGGVYVTAKDVGIGSPDLKQIKTKTPHVLGIDGEAKSSGDPSPATAWGVYQGMKATAKHAFGTDSLKGLTIAMQGLGAVSFGMLEHLAKEGAKVIGTDIDPAKIEKAKKQYGITGVGVEEIYDQTCDIFSPCALGSSVNVVTLPRIKAKAIAGAANNQLATDEIGLEVMKRGILYAPDYAINAGGLMNIYHESMVDGGYNHDRAFSHIAKIAQTIDQILTRAKAENLPSSVVADRMAEERVKNARR